MSQIRVEKCCIGYSKDVYLLLQINKTGISLIEFLTVGDFASVHHKVNCLKLANVELRVTSSAKLCMSLFIMTT